MRRRRRGAGMCCSLDFLHVWAIISLLDHASAVGWLAWDDCEIPLFRHNGQNYMDMSIVMQNTFLLQQTSAKQNQN